VDNNKTDLRVMGCDTKRCPVTGFGVRGFASLGAAIRSVGLVTCQRF